MLAAAQSIVAGHHQASLLRVSGEEMADTKTLIERAYAAFNERNVDGALSFMSDDVSWPKASEGGRVVGKEEILDNGANSIPMSNR